MTLKELFDELPESLQTELRGKLTDNWRENINNSWVKSVLLGLAYKAAINSPDPSTQVGALLITRDDRVFTECNRPPSWMTPEQLADRDLKNLHIIHAERGVIYKAMRAGADVYGSVMFAPWACCSSCAQTITQTRVDALIVSDTATNDTPPRWLDSVIQGQKAVLSSQTTMYAHTESCQIIGGEDVFIRFDGQPKQVVFKY